LRMPAVVDIAGQSASPATPSPKLATGTPDVVLDGGRAASRREGDPQAALCARKVRTIKKARSGMAIA
jgi:hypothetical protein